MKKIKQTQSIEIDLEVLLKIFWYGKWKILAITVGLFLATYIYLENFLPKKFTAITEIMPATKSVENKFITYNNAIEAINEIEFDVNKKVKKSDNNIRDDKTDKLKFKEIKEGIKLVEITKSYLYDSFIEILQERLLIEEAIYKYSLLDSNMYNDETEFKDAISKFTSSIKILSPNTEFKKHKQKNYEKKYTTIQVSISDTKKWKEILKYLEENINKQIQNDFTMRIEEFLSIKKTLKKMIIENLDLKIANFVSDYERQTYDNVSFLKEQAAIARKLNIAKNTLETQLIASENVIFGENNSPFYMRGYEAIEKEIELIKSRDDRQKKAFIPGLFETEKTKRSILQNNLLDRAELIVQSSPLFEEDFYAATIKVGATKFISTNHNKLYFFIIILGLIIGMMYTLLSSSHRFR